MKAREISFWEIKTGDTASFEKTVTADDIIAFADISGDHNPLHVDGEYALGTEFGGVIAHGMFIGALVSRLIGMELPGQKSLLLKESLEFKKAVRIGDTLLLVGMVVFKSETTRIVEVSIRVHNQLKELIASGDIHVKVLK